jgi:hypothetical protein
MIDQGAHHAPFFLANLISITTPCRALRFHEFAKDS